MAIGNWEPEAPKTKLTVNMLTPALSLTDPDSFPAEAPAAINALKPFANSFALQWEDVLAQLSDEQLISLIRFFTLAESQWSDWHGGDRNPVIWLCKALKKRGLFPDKELTAWIKNNSDNRFLPYGNALG